MNERPAGRLVDLVAALRGLDLGDAPSSRSKLATIVHGGLEQVLAILDEQVKELRRGDQVTMAA
jgi:hypothetical protein